MTNLPMRLPQFILENIEPILVEWEAFAREIWPGTVETDPTVLRNDAAKILRTTAVDMGAPQTERERSEKSRGHGGDSQESVELDHASHIHAMSRMRSGFDLRAVLAEYRALRASVVRLWRESRPQPDANDLDDLTRFHESLDQSLTRAVTSYTLHVERSRQMFLAILGHDLRNPLNSVSLNAQALTMEAPAGSAVAELAQQVVSSSVAMARMLADLLVFTSGALGSAMPIAPAEMDLGTLCDEVVAEIRAGHPRHTIRVTRSGDLAGQWDAARLRQVISNLLGNAIQHGEAGAPVSITVSECNGDKVCLEVHNSGSPIARELLPRIFDPLIRGEFSEHRRPAGSLGLGLYIAREVVLAHGGTIDVASSKESGTTFSVRLPKKPAGR
jgi:signal transduction histidine kinase